jgi:hypothetical protein
MLTAMTVFGFAMTGALGLLTRSTSLFHYDSGKLRVNNDIRSFTSEMSDNATYSNHFLVYPSFADRTAPVNDGLSGDFLVLVYRDPADQARIERLVGYYRAPADALNPASEGPVRKFDLRFNPSSTQAVAALLPAVTTSTGHPEVVELSRGLSNGRLFYNFLDRSIMVKGEIIHRGSLERRATNTYNFTVSPRG